MSDSNTSSGGIGLASAVFLVFLTLKLVGVMPVAAWSWWWVTSPLWISAGLGLGVFALILAVPLTIAGVVAAVDYFRK